jgi:glycosyltransferase involved in cell wall biosynthesis
VEEHKPRIAIVVPAFNEAASLPRVLAHLGELQAEHPEWTWLCTVVNDGSTDDTRHLIERWQQSHKIAAVHSPVNIGIGAAVQAGFQVAVEWNADVVVQCDGDGQHPVEAIIELVTPILQDDADVVVGSRYISGAGGAVSSFGRQLGTRWFAWLLRLVAGVRIRDVTSGFRAFGRDAATYIGGYYPDDYPEVESYVPLARARFRFAEVPVTMSPRTKGRSSISRFGAAYYLFKVSLAVLIHLIKAIPRRKGPS